jgi:hypothetical protein
MNHPTAEKRHPSPITIIALENAIMSATALTIAAPLEASGS